MPTATPYSAVNNRFLGNEKDVEESAGARLGCLENWSGR